MTNLELLREALRRIEKLEGAVFPPIDLRATDEDQRVNDPRFPSRREVEIYFKQCGRTDPEADWEGFFLHYDAQGWRAGNGVEVGNWKSLAGKWLRKNTKAPELVLTSPEPVKRPEYVPPRNPVVEERMQEKPGVPCPPEVREMFRKLGMRVPGEGRENVSVNSDLRR